MNLVIYATYCSAKKRETSTLLPAEEMYLSERIDLVQNISRKENHPFYILSGKYGFIHSKTIISYYDHLLTAQEVPRHIELVTSQLTAIAPDKIIFYHTSIQKDPLIIPYLETLRQACSANNILLEFRITEFCD